MASASFHQPFEHIKGHSKSSNLKSYLNNLADSLAKAAANSSKSGLFTIQPSLSSSNHIKRGSFHIHSPSSPIKPTTINIHNLLLNNSQNRWPSAPILRFNNLANTTISASVWPTINQKKKMPILNENHYQQCPCLRCNVQEENLPHLLWNCTTNNQTDLLHKIESLT
eukprot:TRINITY_DN8038_c0_g3_i1.p1 TRINITY_DN8038_c0_g3~~TRINITY_DN8038_c0_g3_i1.p1  ORF type:complete len:168 (-),score=34.75 TRINITY_DN8038_c0_g3_i1:146-649(-)